MLSYYFQVVGDTLNISQPSVCRAVWGVTEALCAIAHEYIFLPDAEEAKSIHVNFHDRRGFPNVVGLIDGTHIKIMAPSEHEEVFVNRKM